MIPADLKAESFRGFDAESRSLAEQYIDVLRELPPAVCPSFLLQIRNTATSFPAEQESLRTKLDALRAMSPEKRREITEPLHHISLAPESLRRDWVNDPATFITEMTAHLWASAQIERFREGTNTLFAALPEPQDTHNRLTIVVLGRGVDPQQLRADFGKLRQRGVLFQQLDESDVPRALLQVVAQRAVADFTPYAHWYVDGGAPWNMPPSTPAVEQVSYQGLHTLRMRVLGHMKDTIISGDAGTEEMRTRLSGLTAADLGAQQTVADPLLQRFYTELFTLSSGPQMFSTSFVQWTGRELMRRAKPRTVLLRYAPRQRYRPFNEMVEQVQAETVADPEGAFRDAKMGAYYAWLEAKRMAPVAPQTMLVWVEGTSKLLLIGAGAPGGAEIGSPFTLHKALQAFS